MKLQPHMKKTVLFFTLAFIYLIILWIKSDSDFDIGLKAYYKENYTKVFKHIQLAADKNNSKAQYDVFQRSRYT